MREIKFRFFTGGEMYPDMWLLAGVDGSMPTVNDALNMYPDTVVMQYTGLKDKNGVEIYEGDIVKVKSRLDCVIGQVVYKDTSFGFNVPVSNEFEERFRGLNTGWYGTEVIGKYRETERGGLSDTEEYSRVILDHGKDYHCIRATLKKLAQANNVEPFDFVSEPFMESLAKMKRD